jgi:hypothetical protein
VYHDARTPIVVLAMVTAALTSWLANPAVAAALLS